MWRYREIIKIHLREIIKKRDKSKTERERKYWGWIKGQLIEDLRDYEDRGIWKREPYDKAFEKYRPTFHLTLDDIIRRFFEDEFF